METATEDDAVMRGLSPADEFRFVLRRSPDDLYAGDLLFLKEGSKIVRVWPSSNDVARPAIDSNPLSRALLEGLL
jgi:hypothetical protein